tara:strand:+ start:4531 stop:5544 length:1014 start_codon:yes stop_codon:yes gene_type:complete
MSKARDIADGAANINLLDDVTAGTVAASKVIAADSNKDVASFRNVTLTGELDAATLDVSGNADIDGVLETDGLSINGTSVTATAAELNILDGVTSTTAELNILDGVTSTTAELNYSDGVTSNIQTQLDAKQALDSNLTSFVSAFTLPTSDGSNGQVLTTNGSGTLSLADAAGGGAYELLTTVTWSSTVDYVDLTSGFSSTYDTYIIEWTDVEHSHDYGTMKGYLKRGSTWYTSGVYYYTEISGTSVQEMSSQGGMDLGYSGKTGYYYGKANGFIQLRGVNNTDTEGPTYFSMSPTWTKGWITMGGLYSGTEAVTGFRLDGSQSFASGQMRMYGLKKS